MGKRVMFVFILEVLDDDGPRPGSFWEVLKKCRHHPHLLKKPKSPSVATPMVTKPKVPPVAPPVALALTKEPEEVGDDLMDVAKPTAPTDPTPTPAPSLPSLVGLDPNAILDLI